jgi:hypothetical protein
VVVSGDYKALSSAQVLMYTRGMNAETDRNRKEPVTIRLDAETRGGLQKLAHERKRTVSSLIDQAVQTFLDQQLGRVSTEGHLLIRHAMLPDTAVFQAFAQLERKRFDDIVARTGLPELRFVPKSVEWRNLQRDVFSGDYDVIEGMNRLPIRTHVEQLMQGASSPPIDWIAPFLQVFVGHCVFLRGDHLREFLSDSDLQSFLEFRKSATTGKDLSLRSLVAWAAQSEGASRVSALSEAWAAAIIGCQLGTDFDIAVRRVSALLDAILESRGSPRGSIPLQSNVVGIESLERSLEDFRCGTHSAFTGGLLHSAELFHDESADAFLLAGPADLRIPSLNTLGLRKGMLDPNGPSAAIGRGLLELWREASLWFQDDLVTGRSGKLPAFINDNFPRQAARDDAEIEILRGLMQTWVRWFESPEAAQAFMGDRTTELVEHFQELGANLYPTRLMPAPAFEEVKDPLWPFPTLQRRGASSAAGRVGQDQ